MNQQQSDVLRQVLTGMGIPANDIPDLSRWSDQEDSTLFMPIRTTLDDRPIQLLLELEKTDDLHYHVKQYEVRLREQLEIGHEVIGGINTRTLEERMKEIDWKREVADPLYRYLRIPDGDRFVELYPFAKVIADVFTLAGSGPEGKEMADRLQMKYWVDQGYKVVIPDLKSLQEWYETRNIVVPGEGHTIRQIYPALLQQEHARMDAREGHRKLLPDKRKEKLLSPASLQYLGKKSGRRKGRSL